jgi:hypothetical protein
VAQRVKTVHDVGGSQGLLIGNPAEDEARAKESSARQDRQLRASLAAQMASMLAPAGQRGGTSTYSGPDISVGRETAERGSQIANPWNRPDDRPQGVYAGRTIQDGAANNNPWAQAMGRAFTSGGSNPAMNAAGGPQGSFPAVYNRAQDQGGFGMNSSMYPGEKDRFGNTRMSGSPTPWANVVHDGGLGPRPNSGMGALGELVAQNAAGGGGAPGAPGGSPTGDPVKDLHLETAKEQLALQRREMNNKEIQEVQALFGDAIPAIRAGEALDEEIVSRIEAGLMAQPHLRAKAAEMLKTWGAEGAVNRKFQLRSHDRQMKSRSTWGNIKQGAKDFWGGEYLPWAESHADERARAMEQRRRMGMGFSEAPVSPPPRSLVAGPGEEPSADYDASVFLDARDAGTERLSPSEIAQMLSLGTQNRQINAGGEAIRQAFLRLMESSR